jgi:hypothetical protein
MLFIDLLYKVCKSNDIKDNAMKSFTIDTNIDILIGKINNKTRPYRYNYGIYTRHVKTLVHIERHFYLKAS